MSATESGGTGYRGLLSTQLFPQFLEFIFGMGLTLHTVDIKHTIEMIDFMLENSGVELLRHESIPASEQPMFHDDPTIAFDQSAYIGNRQATFIVQREIIASLDDAGVEETIYVRVVATGIEHDHDRAHPNANLWCGEAYSIS